MNSDRPSHLDAEGRAAMVDVSDKATTRREACAEVRVHFPPGVRERALAGESGKGELLAVARVAGIQAAKRTAELIPLCHALPLARVEVRFERVAGSEEVLRVECRALAEARTGVEMEALTGAAVAGLTVYDMAKALDKGIRLEGLRLLWKVGGKSGRWELDPGLAPNPG